MNESLKAQYEYFIAQCKTLEELQAQEKRLCRSFYEIPDQLKMAILDKKEKLLNQGDIKK